MADITLLAGHPFFRHADVTVHDRGRCWKVIWRDFLTVKQDAEFKTEAEAKAFAETINKPPLLATWGHDVTQQDWADADAFWRSCDK